MGVFSTKYINFLPCRLHTKHLVKNSCTPIICQPTAQSSSRLNSTPKPSARLEQKILFTGFLCPVEKGFVLYFLHSWKMQKMYSFIHPYVHLFFMVTVDFHRVSTSNNGCKILPRDTTWSLMLFPFSMPSMADILPAMYVFSVVSYHITTAIGFF